MRKKQARVVLGFHAVLARLRAEPASIIELFVDETRQDARVKDLVASAERAGVRLMRVPTRRLDGFYGGGRHQGVVARIEVRNVGESVDEVLEELAVPALLLVLDGVTDPNNLGACLRVANAAGAHAVLAPKDHAVGITPAVSKVASGAAEATPYLMVTNLARTLGEIMNAISGWSAPTRTRSRTCTQPTFRKRSRGCWARRAMACGA